MYKVQLLTMGSGCEPLTPDDIAEVIVFAAGRRENVIIADTLIFPNHQVSESVLELHVADAFRLLRLLCTRSRESTLTKSHRPEPEEHCIRSQSDPRCRSVHTNEDEFHLNLFCANANREPFDKAGAVAQLLQCRSSNRWTNLACCRAENIRGRCGAMV